MTEERKGLFFEQLLPLVLTVVVMLGLWGLVFLAVKLLNLFPVHDQVILRIRFQDILVGATVYFKTAVDFAIFMGRLMATNPGWKNRIAIEIGTALGNGLGTIGILAVWIFFKEVDFLLAIMIFIASLVLFELAHASLEHFVSWEGTWGAKRAVYLGLSKFLNGVLRFTKPVIAKIMPDLGDKLRGREGLPWRSLLFFSFSVPFILGLDDFAGYVPLFSIVNVFGFGLGVVSAHTLLNIGLFIDPGKTVNFVRNEWVSFLGTLAFIGLAVWGLVETVGIFFT